MADESLVEIVNTDIADLVNRAYRYAIQNNECPSHSSNETSEADRIRMRGELGQFASLFGRYAKRPRVDAPHSGEHPIVLDRLPVFNTQGASDDKEVKQETSEFPPIKNRNCAMVRDDWMRMASEMVASDSASDATGFSEADAGRMTVFLERLEDVIDGVDEYPAIDLPNVETISTASGGKEVVRAKRR